MSNIKTATLTGSEQSVTNLGGCNCCIKNNSAAVIYASATPDITAGADGVMAIQAGESAVYLGNNGTIYLLGTGEALLVGSDYNTNFFKPSSGAGGGVTKDYVDGGDAATLSTSKDYADTLFAGVTSFSVLVVAQLPTTNIDTHTIYFVPKSTETDNNYDEYMYINNAWEHIGSTTVDLSGYYTKTEVDTIANGKAGTAAATQSADGLMSSVDKTKLDGVAAGANAYTHPAYTARTGVPTANQTPAFGGVVAVTQPVSDATGHITGMNSRNITIPSTAASASAAGLVTTGAQTIAGAKTFNGSVIPAGASAIGTAQARKIYAGTADMTAGTSALETGAIYIVYE